MRPEEIKVIRPEPYYNIIFRCGNRKFYNVKSELYDMWEESGIDDDFDNGYFDEKCDYEGDLEKIVLYNIPKAKPFLEIVINYYKGDIEELGEMDLVLSIF
jgi:hypothetical protein